MNGMREKERERERGRERVKERDRKRERERGRERVKERDREREREREKEREEEREPSCGSLSVYPSIDSTQSIYSGESSLSLSRWLCLYLSLSLSLSLSPGNIWRAANSATMHPSRLSPSPGKDIHVNPPLLKYS
jgi:hypothetical protein